jgi:hypothetical protein
LGQLGLLLVFRRLGNAVDIPPSRDDDLFAASLMQGMARK